MKTYRILVCGSNYGRSYLRALQLNSQKYRLVGLLARGSLRSRSLAAEYRVPLYRRVEEVPEETDLACVAVGSEEGQVVLGLLKQGIHVLAEHPQRTRVLREALGMAGREKLCLHINPHFSDLKAPSLFVESCRKTAQQSPLRFLCVEAADRALYGALALLQRSVGNLSSLVLRKLAVTTDFVTLNGTLGTVGINLCLQNSKRPGQAPLTDGSPGYVMDIRMGAFYASTTISMLSVAGPVVTNSSLSATLTPESPFWSCGYEEAATGKTFDAERTLANLVAIDRLASHIKSGETPAYQSADALLELVEAWERTAEWVSGRCDWVEKGRTRAVCEGQSRSTKVEG